MGLYMNKAVSARELTMVNYACQVNKITPLSVNTFKVELQLPAGSTQSYQAGQYLQLSLDINNDGQTQSFFYSIANRFNKERPCCLQLFIQKSGELADKILKHLSELNKKNINANVTLPMGQAFLQTDLALTHLLIAAGSGISKIKCLTEEILRQEPDADLNIYWSNKNANDFYLLKEFQGWVNKNKNLNFTPVLESSDTGWLGRSGYIYKVIEKDFIGGLDGVRAYLCGSPKMVYGTIDKLKPRGLKEENCYSDVFEYMPRDQKVAI